MPMFNQSPVSGGVAPRTAVHSDVGEPNQAAAVYKNSTCFHNTLWVPTGIDAVSIGVWNDVSNVSTYTGVKVGAQTSTGGAVDNPSAAMKRVTFGGSDSPTFVGGTPLAPAVIWSDVMPVVNQGAGISSLIARVYYPAGVANPGGGYYVANAMPVSRQTKLAALGAPVRYAYTVSDRTTDNAAVLSSTSNVLPIHVELFSRRRIRNIWQFGDSTRQGWYGDGCVSALERFAIAESIAGRPTACMNLGHTGQTSAEYLARLRALVASGKRCDVLVYQVASPVDGSAAGTSEAQIARAYEAIKLAQQLGAVIVLDGPFPMVSGTPSAAVQAVVNGAKTFVLDMSSAPGVVPVTYDGLHGATYGGWVPAYNYNGDGQHQTESATTAVIYPALSAALAAALSR